VKRLAVLAAVVTVLGLGVAAATEQEVRAIVPKGGRQQVQQIQPIGPQAQQAVQGIGGAQAQQVGQFVEPTKGQKMASNTAKVVTGITAAAVSLGATAAMLLLL
jgi:hypothetical protein